MKRRDFLKGLSVVPVVAVVPSLLQAEPHKIVEMNRRVAKLYVPDTTVESYGDQFLREAKTTKGNKFLTTEEVTNEALRVLERQLRNTIK